jgi:NAD(P)-dependent dehydrogenase (short-subunit alcohol dehydrogenase family)
MRSGDDGRSQQRGVALVTGAARGMGAAVARRLAAPDVSIAALDLQSCAATVEAIGSLGCKAREYRCDVRDWAGLARTVERIELEQGPVRTVASIAGVWEAVPFLELEPDSWSRVVDVNLTGSFQVCRLAASRMAERRSGSIVCIASNAAYLAWSGGAHYSASKAGLVALVKAMALELGPHGIRVNAVCPGTVRTPANSEELDLEGVEESEAAACPVGRIGDVNDIAEAVAFLADDERSAWVTGTSLLVDGGYGTHGAGPDFGSRSRSVTADFSSAATSPEPDGGGSDA